MLFFQSSHSQTTGTKCSSNQCLGCYALLQDGGPEVVDGLRVKRSSRKGKAGEMGAAGAPKPALERSVCNCLACGKVYDCRSTFSTDTVAFIGM